MVRQRGREVKNVLKIGALQIDLDAVNEDALEAHAQRLGVPPDASLNDAAGAVAKHTMTTTPAPVQGECEKCGGPLDERQERCALCGDLVPAPECTDLGNADRFVRRNLGRARYCAALGGWMIYCGPRWAADEPAAVRLAKDTARSIYGELERGAGDDPEALGKHAIKSQSAHALMAMLQLAQSE